MKPSDRFDAARILAGMTDDEFIAKLKERCPELLGLPLTMPADAMVPDNLGFVDWTVVSEKQLANPGLVSPRSGYPLSALRGDNTEGWIVRAPVIGNFSQRPGVPL